MSFLYHPAFQSLVLPPLLAGLGMLLLRASAGPRWAPLGAALGLLAALAVLPGFDWPASARVQKLPWIVLAGTALAAGCLWRTTGTSSAARWWPWGGAVLAWAAACFWLVGAAAGPLQQGMALLGGAAALALLLLIPASGRLGARGVPVSAGLTLASLALAGLAGTGGSLLLAQLALMLAAVVAVPGLWAWWRPSSGLVVSPAALLPLGLAWLVIATSLLMAGPGATPTEAAPEDPYYTPRWK
jgi:hypothetical protein